MTSYHNYLNQKQDWPDRSRLIKPISRWVIKLKYVEQWLKSSNVIKYWIDRWIRGEWRLRRQIPLIWISSWPLWQAWTLIDRRDRRLSLIKHDLSWHCGRVAFFSASHVNTAFFGAIIDVLPVSEHTHSHYAAARSRFALWSSNIGRTWRNVFTSDC